MAGVERIRRALHGRWSVGGCVVGLLRGCSVVVNFK
jgi:hypothetical protein